MSDRLQVRVALITVVVMALTLGVVALVTWQLIQAGERGDVDAVLRQELAEVEAGLPGELAGAAGLDGVSTPAELQLGARRSLATNPGTERHLTALEVGGERFVTQAGPEPLRRLRDGDGLPAGSSGAGGIALVVGGLLLFLAVGRALHPLAALAAASRGLGRDDHTRVPEPRRKDEVGTLAREFNDMVDRLAAAEEDRRQLLSAVSHELRTPLAVARGHREVFQAFGPGAADSARQTAAVLQRELVRLGRIVEDLTAVTRGEVGQVQREPVFAPDVVEQLRQRLGGLGIDDVDLEEVPPVVLLADEDRIVQSLLNLVLNARTHTPAGTPVRVRGEVAGTSLRLGVEDDGPGIDPEVLPRVFEPFVTTRPGGAQRTSGLGLAVVRSLTEAQGGTVSVDPGWPGTRIVITLPLSGDQADGAGG